MNWRVKMLFNNSKTSIVTKMIGGIYYATSFNIDGQLARLVDVYKLLQLNEDQLKTRNSFICSDDQMIFMRDIMSDATFLGSENCEFKGLK